VDTVSRTPNHFALFALINTASDQPGTKILQKPLHWRSGQRLTENFNERSIPIQRRPDRSSPRGMVHEINNWCPPQADNPEQPETDGEKTDRPYTDADNTLITNELVEIQKNVRKIINTTRMFGRIAAKDKNEVLRIDEIVNETIHFMRDLSEGSRVKITFTPPEHLLVIKNQATSSPSERAERSPANR
jgi:hypothetical protein